MAAIFSLGRSCAPRPEVSTVPDTITISEATHGRPEPTPPTGVGGVVHHTVPVAASTTHETPDSALATRYAKLALRFAEYRVAMDRRAREHDTLTPPPPAPPEVLPPMALSYSGTVLTLWLTPSSGRVSRFTTLGVLRPGFTVTTGRGGSTDTRPLVIEDRAWVQAVREVKGCLLPTGVALALGAVLFPKNVAAAAGTAGGVALTACLWD
jgi:hypothetical protein